MNRKILSKKQYQNMRRKVRKNIFLNSKDAFLKRTLFRDEYVLMGGVVIERIRLVKKSYENVRGNVRLSELSPLSKKKDVDDEEVGSYFCQIRETPELEFKIFDFSGIFRMGGFVDEEAKEIRQMLFKIKEGDIVYVMGKIIPMNGGEGYFLLSSMAFNEEELTFYRTANKKQFMDMKKEVEKIKLAEVKKGPFDDLCYNFTMGVVRPFLKKGQEIDSSDYHWLVSAVCDLYSANPSPKLARIALKYSYKHLESQEISGVWDRKTALFSLFPGLECIMKEQHLIPF